MAKKGRGVISVTELVTSLRIPRPFLRKILQALTKKGFVKSYKGIGGGFKLGKSPDRIFLVDLIEVFQGPVSINECMFKKRACPNIRECPLKKRIDSIKRHVESELKVITIGSILK
jgi:Rrf2 family nitric oxide-sensitive transcriptional repressor